MNTASRVTVAFVLAASCLAGCAAESVPTDEAGTEVAEGLSLDSPSKDRVSGTYRRGSIGLVFESAKVGVASSVTLTALDGTELVRIVSDETSHVSYLMNKKLVVALPREGSDASVRLEGDASAADDLKARPEFALVPEMQRALADAGVAPDLLDSFVSPMRIKLDGPDPPPPATVPSGGGSGRGCSTLEKIGCAAWIATCSASCSVATAGTALPVCLAACVATTAAGCLKCL